MLFRPMLAKLLEGKKPKKVMTPKISTFKWRTSCKDSLTLIKCCHRDRMRRMMMMMKMMRMTKKEIMEEEVVEAVVCKFLLEL